MTTTTLSVASDSACVKSKVLDVLSSRLDNVFESANNGASPRNLELEVWGLLLEVGQLLLSLLFAVLCRNATEADLRARGLSQLQATLRLDEDYWSTTTTTFGRVRFPLFAYRDRSGGFGTTTRVPSRSIFPHQQHCRSSELCLEWESRLGSEHPFRTAQEALTYFTHGAVKLEDTTIARHLVAVGSMVDWSWLYRPVEQIREVLRTRATRDVETGLPIIYASTDAWALRRFVDDTWKAEWRMTNGLRLWCVDQRTGEVVHIGGEYTWGDCKEVERIVRRLIQSGHLPADGDYGDGVVARVAWITDGMPWFEDRILSLFPGALVILDAYHAMDNLGKFAAAVWGKGKKKARRFYAQAVKALLGARRSRKGQPKPRKGYKKRGRVQVIARRRAIEARLKRQPTTNAEPLLALLTKLKVPGNNVEDLEGIIRYVENNAYRMDYARYLRLGYQIGSGAMESLHRVAGQLRMKRPGPGWLPESARAVFNLRMLALVGRWDEFWNQPDLSHNLFAAFLRLPAERSL